MGALLGGIEWTGVVALCLDYPKDAFPRPPSGFGIVAPRSEGARMLGCLFVSSLFPDHAPPGRVSLRVLAGGAHDPGAVAEEEGSLVRSLRGDVERLLGARGEPRVLRLIRCRDAIPQYETGHGERVEDLEGRLRALPGLFLAGASYRGFSLPDCVAGAERAAERVRSYLLARGAPRSWARA
jgi:oxygen-dependent protoporphyrinogen oxidase